MNSNTALYDSTSLELLTQIIDRARTGNGGLTHVSHAELSSELTGISQIFSAKDEASVQHETTPWDLAEEETPAPSRRYKIFAKALAADDPLTTLRTLSRDRSPSELYLLQVRIKSRARSRLPKIEKDLPNLKTVEWTDL